MLLFTPGPTPVPESVRQAMATPTLHHRTPEFEAIFKEARERLLKLYGMDECVMLASSGTGAMQACVINFCEKKALTVNAGKFGERFGKIAKSAGKELVELTYEWNTPVNLEDVKEALAAHPDIDAFFVQVCESAGGLRHPVEEIAAYIKSVNASIMVVADGITAVGVEPIDVTHIDALITGSQKALMLPPGLAMIGLSNAAVEKIGAGEDYYFNLASEIKKQQQNTTAYTAATTLIIGLNAIFDEIEKEGIEVLYAATAKRAKATQAALEAIGFEMYPQTPALSMSTVFDEDAEPIRKLLKTKYGVNMAGGQDHLKGKIFRINQMGLIPVYESAWVVNSIELALDELGRRAYDGTAGRVFNQTYYK
ncbi:alanine--glyoxylate aminotransferase family protein [Sulfurovum sp.]|uniref:pyridoxal-phosphate-dependent aminotransferase family protein n=1 Tax=Sulfurovum sp. TaxID=1969726 RepID=UPI002A36E01B|nr:alanine--glyoxylate aminotransferase family protein [Sulfurovum sp.]MDY0402625.1 alanine--glyoxylate aminotransferase family protein [Sulfurovum sp.]